MKSQSDPILITHSRLIIRAVHWLFDTHKCHVVLTEPRTHGAGEDPDVIGWNDESCILIEAKVSVSSFYAEKRKWAYVNQELPLIGSHRFYFMPAHLLPIKTVDPRYGLLWLNHGSIELVRNAPLRISPERHLCAEQSLLVRALRREGERQARQGSYFEMKHQINPWLWTRDHAGNVYRQTPSGMTKSVLSRDLHEVVFLGPGHTKKTQPA